MHACSVNHWLLFCLLVSHSLRCSTITLPTAVNQTKQSCILPVSLDEKKDSWYFPKGPFCFLFHNKNLLRTHLKTHCHYFGPTIGWLTVIPKKKKRKRRNCPCSPLRLCLDCVPDVNRKCWCVTTKGMHAVGQVEVVVLLQCLPEEKSFPKDIFSHFIQLYRDTLTGQSHTHSKMLTCSNYIIVVMCYIKFCPLWDL